MSIEYVALRDLAQELGIDRSNLRKQILSSGLGLDLRKIRTKDSKGQLTLALTSEDAEMFRAARERQGFSDKPKPVANGDGWFYVVQIMPDVEPRRVKLGFASDAQNRLNAFRTVSPSAELVKSWPCKRGWELTVIDSVTRYGCEWLGGEVFDCDDLESLVGNCEAFFLIMPEVQGVNCD